MEEQTGFLGISGKIWGVIAVSSLLAFGLLVTCALIAMLFGIQSGSAF